MARKPWYRSNPDALARVKREVLSRHPRLRFEETNGAVILCGVFEVREGDVVVDEYQVDVELPSDTERGIPVVRETGNRIPRDIDRHVITAEGTLCVVLPEAYWNDNPRGLSLAEFLDGPLREHLAGQSLVDMEQPWPAGEWGHGIKGVLEFYFQVLKTKEPKAFVGLLELLARREAKGHWDCPCGSGKRLRNCHGPTIFNLRDRIPRQLARRALEMLRRQVEAEKRSKVGG